MWVDGASLIHTAPCQPPGLHRPQAACSKIHKFYQSPPGVLDIL